MHMKLSSVLISGFIVTVISGCSHNITLSPDYGETEIINQEMNLEPPKNFSVAYYISPENKKSIVTTPGGGGDSITYTPYKDLNGVIYNALTAHFSDVYSLKSLDNKKFIKKKEIRYIFTPTIKTDSYSDSSFTWPPTQFSIELKTEAVDTNNEVIWSKTIEEEGHAEYDDFKSDFSLTAKRASQKLYRTLVEELKSFPKD